MGVRICAECPIQPEFSLCGDAFDAFGVIEGAEEYRLANPGEMVSCEECRRAIKEIIEKYTIGGRRKKNYKCLV